MLKRLYVHNYKCLVNFEINLDQDISLFLGANGSGKSTVFEVLSKLRRVIVGEEKVGNVFDETDSPRWLKSGVNETRFELDIEIGNDIYRYLLVMEDFRISYALVHIVDTKNTRKTYTMNIENMKLIFEMSNLQDNFA